jgi:hypothetical protein
VKPDIPPDAPRYSQHPSNDYEQECDGDTGSDGVGSAQLELKPANQQQTTQRQGYAFTDLKIVWGCLFYGLLGELVNNCYLFARCAKCG